jgi:TPR repeat protein
MDLNYSGWTIQQSDYQLERDIGSGALGMVSLVTLRSTGEKLALRQLRNPGADDTGATPPDKAFMQEIDFFMAVRPHPAICTFHGFSFTPSRRVLLQYLPEGSLHDILSAIARGKPAPPWYTNTVKAKVVFGFAAAMMHLHAHGAIHRYLTPKNIMFDSNHEPRLVDFGYAKISLDSDQLSQIATRENTPYLAPEAIMQTPYTQSLDVFAFSMILNHLVSNVRPYANQANPNVIAAAILRKDRPPIPECHPVLAKIIAAGWQQDQDERPSFAEIVSHFILVDEPFFPDIDMGEYRDYRDRVMKQTMKRIEDEPLFEMKADLSPEKVALFNKAKADAATGDPEAQVTLGRMYEHGYGVVQDDEEAVRYYGLAARAGNRTGILSSGVMAHAGRGRDVDLAYAVDCYQKAWAAGSQTAGINLAVLTLQGDGFPAPNPAGAAELFQTLANPPFLNRDAQYYLGRLYETGAGVARDPIQARRYLELSHSQGQDGATCDLAGWYLTGRDGIAPNVALGITIFRQAASRGHPMSHYNLGIIYDQGDYEQPVDHAAARDYFEFAAEHGVVLAQVKFGAILCREGRTDVNATRARETLERAARYFRKAAGDETGGNPLAQNNYGKMLMTGEGVPRNYEKAAEYLSWAVAQGQLNACVNLAEIVMNGLDGQPPDREAAIQLLSKARDGGNKEAANKLAQLGL